MNKIVKTKKKSIKKKSKIKKRRLKKDENKVKSENIWLKDLNFNSVKTPYCHHFLYIYWIFCDKRVKPI